MICNIMTGTGFDKSLAGPWSMAWFAVTALFFVVLISRKWLGEEFGLPYNLWGGFVGAFLPYLLIITLSCSIKFSLLGGLLGSFIGAYLFALWFGSSERE